MEAMALMAYTSSLLPEQRHDVPRTVSPMRRGGATMALYGQWSPLQGLLVIALFRLNSYNDGAKAATFNMPEVRRSVGDLV